MKKSWSKPKLIVLFRGNPEESVLSGCKDGNPGGTNPANLELNQCQGVVSKCQDCLILGS